MTSFHISRNTHHRSGYFSRAQLKFPRSEYFSGAQLLRGYASSPVSLLQRRPPTNWRRCARSRARGSTATSPRKWGVHISYAGRAYRCAIIATAVFAIRRRNGRRGKSALLLRSPSFRRRDEFASRRRPSFLSNLRLRLQRQDRERLGCTPDDRLWRFSQFSQRSSFRCSRTAAERPARKARASD
jgi:hypothetical protein